MGMRYRMIHNLNRIAEAYHADKHTSPKSHQERAKIWSSLREQAERIGDKEMYELCNEQVIWHTSHILAGGTYDDATEDR